MVLSCKLRKYYYTLFWCEKFEKTKRYYLLYLEKKTFDALKNVLFFTICYTYDNDRCKKICL